MKIYTKRLAWIAPRDLLDHFAAERGSCLLESVKGGRFSIFVTKPVKVVKTWKGLQKILKDLPKATSNLPFAGGLLGLLNYELVHHFENLPKKFAEVLPRVCFGLYQSGFIFDNKKRVLTVFAWSDSELKKLIEKIKNLKEDSTLESKSSLKTKIKSNFTKSKYIKAIKRVKNLIREGYTFQANISQRFSARVGAADPVQIYKKLAQANPAPFAGYFNAGNFQVLSSSPELLFSKEKSKIETWPIAGTRPRGKDKKEDLMLERELRNSEKENAEHMMLVDLERNDLGRVCEFNSVRVSSLAHIEKYARVQHIVSHVIGKLRKEADLSGILRAVFPGGTITGCPKVETMKIISEIEKSPRGPYTGGLGYVSINGNMQFNILIRTLLLHQGVLSWQAGGGIVADSDPASEYDETLHKAAALFEAILN